MSMSEPFRSPLRPERGLTPPVHGPGDCDALLGVGLTVHGKVGRKQKRDKLFNEQRFYDT